MDIDLAYIGRTNDIGDHGRLAANGERLGRLTQTRAVLVVVVLEVDARRLRIVNQNLGAALGITDGRDILIAPQFNGQQRKPPQFIR